MENKEKFIWRENDNSSSTLLKYQLEAEHWTRAFKGASPQRTTSLTDALGLVGMLFSLVFNIIFLMIVCCVDLVKFCRKRIIN